MAESAELISVVIPVYNEAESIVPCLHGIAAALQKHRHEILICHDTDEDTTLPAVRNMPDRPDGVRFVRNHAGRGPANAMRAGIEAAHGDVIVTMMADLSDDPESIPAMARAVRAGAAVVSGSRYAKGGAQLGGPRLKGLMTRLAGWILSFFAGIGTLDVTNNFRAYNADYVRGVTIESSRGFEMALELTVKAHNQGLRVSEVPTVWRDRTQGESKFDVLGWLPLYLRWFLYAMAPFLTLALVFLALGTFSLMLPLHSHSLVYVVIYATAVMICAFFLRAATGRFTYFDAVLPVLWFAPFMLALSMDIPLPASTQGVAVCCVAYIVFRMFFARKQRTAFADQT